MKILSEKSFGKWVCAGANLSQKTLLTALVIMGNLISFEQAHASSAKVFIQSNQGISGFAGITTKEDGTIAVSGNPKNLQTFDPVTQQFIANFAYPIYSFMDGTALIERPGFSSGLAGSSFLDGRVPTLFDNGALLESNNADTFLPAPGTGLFQATYDPNLIGLEPITYRASNDLLYTGSAFNFGQIFKLDWRGGSQAVPITLSAMVGFNHFQFGPDGNLYSNDSLNDQIVSIEIDDVNNMGTVTPIVQNIPYPVSTKVDSQGNVYFLARAIGAVYKTNLSGQNPTVIATLPPPLDDCCLSLDETLLYVSNNNNGLYQVNIATQQVTPLFTSPIAEPWDIAFDTDGSLYIADLVGIKQFNVNNGKLINSLVFDSTQDEGALVGVGNANGLTVEPGPNGKIIITDITMGNVIVLNKDLSVYLVLNVFTENTGLAFQQPFSTVRVATSATSEYYLATNPTTGQIIKIFNQNGTITNEVFFSGLTGPVKLLLNGNYVYVVEGGDLLNFSTNTGRVSRIPLISNPTPGDQQILVSGLNNPQGLAINGGTMYILEAGNQRVLSASSTAPSVPNVVHSGLEEGNFLVLSQFNPYPVYPFAGLAVDNKGKTLWVNQTGPVNILSIKL